MSTFYADQELLANQFTEATSFDIWLRQKMFAYDNAAEWLDYALNNLDIYTAQGYWLDLLGLIIGQGRDVPDAIPIQFFGFVDTPFALGFGEARFWDGQESLTASSILADPEYRIVLLAKIGFNYADVTLTGITESLSIIFQTDDLTVTNNGTANIDIFIGKTLTITEQNLINVLDLLPRAAGISVNVTFA